jgi:hypothetical protein
MMENKKVIKRVFLIIILSIELIIFLHVNTYAQNGAIEIQAFTSSGVIEIGDNCTIQAIIKNNTKNRINNIDVNVWDKEDSTKPIVTTKLNLPSYEAQKLIIPVDTKKTGIRSSYITIQYNDNSLQIFNLPTIQVNLPKINNITISIIDKNYSVVAKKKSEINLNVINNLSKDIEIVQVTGPKEYVESVNVVKTKVESGGANILNFKMNIKKSFNGNMPLTVVFNYNGMEYRKIIEVHVVDSKSWYQTLFSGLINIVSLISGLAGLILTTIFTALSTNLIMILIEKRKEAEKNINLLRLQLKYEISKHLIEYEANCYSKLDIDIWNSLYFNGIVGPLIETNYDLFQKLNTYYNTIKEFNKSIESGDVDTSDNYLNQLTLSATEINLQLEKINSRSIHKIKLPLISKLRKESDVIT